MKYCLPYYKQTYKEYAYPTAQQTQNAYIKIYSALQDIEREKWLDAVIGLKPSILNSGAKMSLDNVCNHFIVKYKADPDLSIYEYLV